MKKRGAYQKSKERNNKLRNIFCTVAVVLVTLIFIWCITESAVTVSNIDHNTYREYSGDHSCNVVVRHGKYKNTTYRFTLENGDTLVADYSCVSSKEEMEQLDKLSFQYSTFPKTFAGHYRVIAISSADDSVNFVNPQQTREICVEQIWILSIIFEFWLLLWIGVIVISFLLRKKPTNYRR